MFFKVFEKYWRFASLIALFVWLRACLNGSQATELLSFVVFFFK